MLLNNPNLMQVITRCQSVSLRLGSNLGPLLFILFFDDIKDILGCYYDIFADDLKIGRKITSAADAELLQQDINAFDAWCTRNGMKINSDKIMLMSYTRKLATFEYDYKIGKIGKQDKKIGVSAMVIEVTRQTSTGLDIEGRLSFTSVYLKNWMDIEGRHWMMGSNFRRRVYKVMNLNSRGVYLFMLTAEK
ncbi:hypothetical protein M8J76_005013 [Diaphorina citri]|nr:hypothetical protein M8J76_005013 [Diaphorina citri]